MYRQINDASLALIKRWEGCILQPYKDIGGKWTIGIGHLIKPGENFGSEITMQQALDIFYSDVSHMEDYIQNGDMNIEVNDNQYGAIVSLCFNCGVAPLLGTFGKYLQDNNYSAAADEILKWNHVNGVVSEGLTNRRKDERSLFLLTTN